ncbi:hypothetical protein AYM40_19715 [Paraburkholderia phytofirmans OLGA172]|uniref:Uncharacterized protein n=1 Tax=Paraburkholderia phytofirmans OLGA172 TaxID=1417228 RepID=A0A160FPN6_9BURK|nr:hypothetical protein AYM40_19715 [Paraburkholderia phytofirmans OLGA172]
MTVVNLVYGNGAENFDGKAARRSGVNQRRLKPAKPGPAPAIGPEGPPNGGCRRVYRVARRGPMRPCGSNPELSEAFAGLGGGKLPGLARARRRLAKPTDKGVLRIVCMRDKMSAAPGAGGHLQHSGVEEAHQRPGARETEHGLVVVQ